MHCSGRRSPKRRQWHARTASHSLEGQEGRARGPQRPHPQHRRLALQRGHEGDARGQIVVRGVRAALAVALEDQAREQAHGVRKAQRARVHGRAARVGAGRQAACRRSRSQVAPVHFSSFSQHVQLPLVGRPPAGAAGDGLRLSPDSLYQQVQLPGKLNSAAATRAWWRPCRTAPHGLP